MAGDDNSASSEKVITTVCNSHCGGACVLKVHVKDNVITRIETDDGPEPQLRACLKGRSYRQRVYDPDRLKYPLLRVGKRGEGKFERISWDRALDIVAGELKRVRDTFGPASIFLRASAGDIASLHTVLPLRKVLSLLGGCSVNWGFHSYEQGVFAELATLGTIDQSSRSDLLSSKLIVLWACDPVNTVLSTNTTWYMIQAREKGARIISIDARYTDTAATLADQWIPIIPGTDSALLIAMAFVIIKQGLTDRTFIDRYTIGFKQFEDYVLGYEDGIAKDPLWAEAITSVPAQVTEKLALECAQTKPAALLAGLAAGRTAYGEQFHRAAITLSAMTGNVGISGGSAGTRSWVISDGGARFTTLGSFMTDITNPVADVRPNFKNYLNVRAQYFLGKGNVCTPKVPDALLHGKSGGYPEDYKVLFIINANYPNQTPNINKSVEAIHKLEFVVAIEQFLTPSGRWADIVLPSCTFLERNDITKSESGFYFGFHNQIIEPLAESKSHLQIAKELARKLGFDNFENLTEDGILREMVKKSVIRDYEGFKQEGTYYPERPEPYTAFKQEIEDPVHHPFPTPSGKIEIYSQQIADFQDPLLPPIPKYIETWEARSDPLISKYPLQLITTHLRRRAHSQYDKVPWLREIQKQEIQISPEDAAVRNIEDGDILRVFNTRGVTRLPARVTHRIIKGVVAIPQGAWFDPDEAGVDQGGSSNVLTKDEISPGGGFITNTCLVQVEKV
jgi:anaerobic dimethyl sulfoxide reductase subunit A